MQSEGSKPGITCIIQTRNAAATLVRALASVAWADECVVADMGSEDATVAIARRHGARVIDVPWHPRVDGVRNRCLEAASHAWVIVLDADEYLADDAGPALRALVDDPTGRWDVFRLPRVNYMCGQAMRGSRWYPDYQTRLFRHGTVRWSDSHHQAPSVAPTARVLSLRPPCPHIHHVSYSSVRAFVERQVRYALTRRYGADPAAFDFGWYLAEAHQEFALRDDRGRDGDLAHALAQLVAWDTVVRGVLHWASLEPRPPLPSAEAFVDAARAFHRPRARLRRWLARRSPVSYHARRVTDWWDGLARRWRG